LGELLKGWLYLGTALLIGAALFPCTIGASLREPVHRERLRLAAWLGGGMVAAAGLARATLALQAALGAAPFATVVAFLTGTLFGWMALARVALAAALVAAAAWTRRAPPAEQPLALVLTAALALAMLVSISLVSHAEAGGSALLVVMDVIHLAATMFWVASVGLLAWVPTWDGEDLHAAGAAARALSTAALWCAGVALATGIVASAAHLFGIAAFVTTPYGRVLLLKHALFVVVIVLAAFHRLRGLPLFFDAAVPERFRGALRLESLVLAEVLVVTGVLTSLPPAVHG